MATVLLLVAIVAFRRLSAGLSNSGGSILNFLNRGGGGVAELPKPPMPTALRRGTAIAMQAGGAAMGVPPSVTGLAIAGARKLRGKPHSTGPAAHAPDPQMSWWSQQHQGYGAQHQRETNNPSQTPTPPSSPVATTTPPNPATTPPVTQLLQQLPALHPAVAGAVGAMPQQLQVAGSLPSHQSSPRRAPQAPAASAPPTNERARAVNAASSPPPQQHPRTTQRSRQQSTPAAATSAPHAPRKRVTDVINTR